MSDEWRDWKLMCDRIAEQRDEWRERLVVAERERDRLAEALREIYGMVKWEHHNDNPFVVQIREVASAVLAECAGTPELPNLSANSQSRGGFSQTPRTPNAPSGDNG